MQSDKESCPEKPDNSLDWIKVDWAKVNDDLVSHWMHLPKLPKDCTCIAQK